jgi:T5SS/PEP-CTERM-associated repeat protein
MICKTILHNTICSSVLLALLPASAWCQTKTWVVTSGNWADDENWLPTGAPNSVGVTAQINNGGTASVTTTASVGSLHLGRASTETGHLVILPSGHFTNTILYAGDAGTGSARLEGGAWTATSIRVGNTGTGDFTVSLGGQLTSGSSYLGFEPNALGEAVVQNANSKWKLTAGSTLHVGWKGEGNLNIQNAGAIEGGNGSLGTFATGVGEATVDGGTWLYDLEMNVGVFGGRGILNIQNGGTVAPSGASTSYSYLGWGQNSHGEAIVKDADSLWTVNGPFYVGYSGTGKLTISDDAMVENAWVDIANWGGSWGEATVTLNGTWKSNGYMEVGNHGNGKLNIIEGGLVENEYGYVAYQSTSVSSVLVDGENSLWDNSEELIVGHLGNATIDISNQATVADTNGWIGNSTGSRGTVNVNTDGVWDNSGDLIVGYLGRAALNIADGGTVQNNAGMIGWTGNSRNNVVNVGGESDTGPSAWQNREKLVVGEFGAGTLNVTSGGRVESEIASFGNSGGGSGIVNVNGGTLEIDSLFIVGNAGTGTLTVTGGGTVTANGTGATVAETALANGTIMVDGEGAVMDVAGNLVVAAFGKGQIQITNDALVLSDSATIGFEPGSMGNASVDNAAWEMTGNFSVGAYGEGNLEILNGGVVENEVGTVNSSVPRPGDPPNPLSTATVAGSNASGGSRWLSRGDLLVGMTGPAELRLLDGGFAASETEAYIGPQGSLAGDGSLSAPLVRNDGVVAPGTSPGTLTIDGNFTQHASGKLQIELASPNSYDVLNVTGQANLGGTLEIILLEGFLPAPTDTFDILAAGSRLGTFSNVTVIADSMDAGTFSLGYTSAGLMLSNFQPIGGVAGDYNDDGSVDAADYVVWRKSDGTQQGYGTWRSHFGQTASSGAGSTSRNAVPEPDSILLFLTLAAAGAWSRSAQRLGKCNQFN